MYKIYGVSYCVFTRHQAKGVELGDMSISLRGDSSIMQNGSTYLGYQDDGVSERCDLCAMVIPPDTISRNMDRDVLFYEAISDASTDRDADREHFFAFGYPSKLTVWECSDRTEAIDLSQVQVHGRFEPPESNWYGLPGLTINVGSVMGEQCKGDFDGFSGGPVFSIHSGHRTIRFEGITTRADKGRLLFLPEAWVAKLCGDHASSRKVSPSRGSYC